jgi:predicted Zn finger-like uncharacterized protein
MIVKCWECGAEINIKKAQIDRAFVRCTRCGSWVDFTEEMKSGKSECRTCGEHNTNDSTFCSKCGNQMKQIIMVEITHCKKCDTEYSANDKYCKKDGSLLKKKLIEKESVGVSEEEESTENDDSETKVFPIVTNSSEKSFWGKLMDGEFGLAKTFWGYGVFISFIVNIFLRFSSSEMLPPIVLGAYLFYEAFVLVGTWRAATKYTGLSIWKGLAKISVVLGWIGMGWGVLILLALVNA